MLQTLFVVIIAALSMGAYLVVSRRRLMPRANFELKAVGDIQAALTEIAGVTGGSVLYRNEATVYQNGALLEAMMDDIAGATQTVHFETFVWAEGALEERFVALLCEKAKQGVSVRVLVDAIGGWKASRKKTLAMRDNGVKVARYHPVNRFGLRRFNNRTHRKLLITDGQVGYVFGHGIKDTWCGNAADANQWRDTGVRLRGKVTGPLQSIFVQDWIDAGQELPISENCFTDSTGERGAVAAHIVASSNRGGHSSVALLYMLAIASARKEVIIQNPYFAPEEKILKLLENAVQRGVQVYLMVPGDHTDSRLLRLAGQHLYGPLLQAGVKLFEYEPNLLHQKVVVIDGIWSHIGTTNFDARSLALNTEVGIGILDVSIARELRSAFESDRKRSKEITLKQWRERRWYQRAVERAAYQVHGQL